MSQRGSKISERFYKRDHTVKMLQRENKILCAEIRRLNRIIGANDLNDPTDASDTYELWRIHKKEASLIASPSYVRYLVSKITGGSLFAFSKKAMGYFRKFKLVSTVMRIASSLFAIIGTGAFFLFFSSAIVFIIPFIVAFCMLIYFLGTVWRARAFRMIEKAILKKQIYVFFPIGKRELSAGSAFNNTLRIISSDTKNHIFILIVSPHVFSSHGIISSNQSFYPIARFESDNVCVIRRHAFFLLRKRVLGLAEDRILYIH